MTALPPARYFDRSTPPHITTLVLVTGTSAISMNIFLAALPSMAVYFDTPYAIMQFTVGGYLALTGLMQLFLGPLSDRFGRRPVLLTAFFIFILASIGASTTTDFETFMAFRCLQAVVVTGMVIGRATVRDIAAREKAASMIGYVTMGMALAPMLAPPIGGMLSDAFGWQACFYALAIAGFGALMLVYFDQGETNLNRARRFSDQFRSYPALLTSRRFWGYTLTCVFASGCFFAYLGGAPFVGGQVYGLSAAEVGLYLSITPLGYAIGNGISGRYAARFGIYRMILTGATTTLAAMIGAYLTVQAGVDHPLGFFAFTVAIGLGNGMVLPSANAGLLDVRPELAGSAAGLSGAMMTLGGAGLSALSGFLLSPGSGAYPLIICIAGSAAASLCAALYTISIERSVRGPGHVT